MTVEIRQARIEDAPTLHRNCKSGATPEQVQAQLEWTCRERGPQMLEHFVAVDGEDVVGNVMVMPKTAHAVMSPDGGISLCRGRAGPVAEVCRLDDWVVHGPYQGTGVATALVEAVLDEARRWGATMVESSSPNPRAIRALEKLGFHEWGRFPDPAGYDEVFVVLTL